MKPVFCHNSDTVFLYTVLVTVLELCLRLFDTDYLLCTIAQITIEKIIFEQSDSHYELQGEYVLPGARDPNPIDGKGDGCLKRLMSGHLGTVISSMGRWRVKLEVRRAEIAELLPLARLLSRSPDPVVLSRSKVVLCFICLGWF